MPGFTTLRTELMDLRAQRDLTERELQVLREQARKLERALLLAQRAKRVGDSTITVLQAQIRDLRLEIAEKRRRLFTLREDARAKLEELNNLDPEEVLIANLDARTPFLLFPVRIETRFMAVEEAPGKQLWIRVYPDDILIDTHEDILSESEVAAAQEYWKEIFTARQEDAEIAEGEDPELAAWRVLVGAYGGNRSAWIVKNYVPNNMPVDPDPYPAEPTFDEVDTKLESWSRPPKARLMPDRFRFLGYNGGQLVIDAAGAPVPEPLIVGPDPSQLDGEAEAMGRDGAEVRLDPAMRWMGDFDEAVTAGMAIRILEEHILRDPDSDALLWQPDDGIERLLVVGLRLSEDETQSQQSLETLFDNHHYATDGLSLLPVGTATNNTEGGGAGYNSFDLGEEESYALELGDPQFQIAAGWKKRTDGELLARWLGINPDVFAHIQHAGGFDQRDARAMNTALWPGTLGYFMEEMMHPVFSDDTVARTRAFFSKHVRGRGSVPSIRKGKQPYGILVSGPLSRTYHVQESDSEGTNYSYLLHDFLLKLRKDWAGMLDQVSHAGKDGDPYEILLDIIGLHGGSEEMHERTVVGPDYFTNYMNFLGLSLYSTQWNEELKAKAEELLSRMGYDLTESPLLLEKTLFTGQVLLDGPLVDDVPASEEEPVRAYTDDDRNYIQWLHESDLETIEDEKFDEAGELEAPQSLLYLVLRHSVQLAWWDAAMKLQGYTAPEFKIEPELLHIEPAAPYYSKVDFLHAKDAAVTGDDRTIATYMFEEDLSGESDAEVWEDVKDALEMLINTPTAKLERAFTETLDACSYRLDSWQLGLVKEKLLAKRYSHIDGDIEGSWDKGILLGAFGWVENLMPSEKVLTEVDTEAPDFPPELQPADGSTVYSDSENAGFIHGPSLNHAVTSAVLRNGYLTHADEEDGDSFAVNLSSERVRTGLELIEGVRNGQGLAELLGYQFERALHDRHEEAEMDQYIFPIRNEFPLYADELSESSEDTPITAKEARNVMNALALLDHVRNSGIETYPWGLALDASDATANAIIDEEVARLQDSLDAVGDLAMSESVYQVVQGNYDRAGAMMAAISEGDNPQDPEIVRTPRSGYALTQRVAVQFEAKPTGYVLDRPTDNPYFGDIFLTARGKSEIGLNKWLAELLPDLREIKCICTFTRDGDASPSEDIIAISDLRLQPIDLLYAIGHRLDNDKTELDVRIETEVRKGNSLNDDILITIDYQTRHASFTDATLTLFEVAPMIGNVRQLVLGSRHLTALDLYLPAEAEEEETVTDGVDLAQLEERIVKAKTNFDLSMGAIETALAPFELEAVPSTGEFDALRTALIEMADYGVLNCYPTSAWEESEASQASLLAQAQPVLERLAERSANYDEFTTFEPDESTSSQLAKWLEAGKAVMGRGFNFIPVFDLQNPDEMNNTVNRDMGDFLSDAGSDFPAEDWLQGLSKVRPKMRGLEMTTLLAENFERAEPELSTLQLPYIDGDKWLGMDIPSDYAFETDKLVVSTVFTTPFDSTLQQAGIVLDDWTEVIPTPNESTGLTFHFDGPNTEAPNTLILAVAPQMDGNWQWEDIVDTLHETLDLAKVRAVEPEQIDDSDYAHFLPPILMAVTRFRTTISTNLLRNVSIDPILNQTINV